MKRSANNQSGFGALAVMAVIVVVGVLGLGGWYVVHAKRHDTSSTKAAASTVPSKAQVADQVTPAEYAKNLMGILQNGTEAALKPNLTEAYATFRTKNFEQVPCSGKSPAHPMVLICGSLLDAKTVIGLSPEVTSYTFKDGTIGKSVTYSQTQAGSDPGTTYYSLKLIPNKSSWQLSDYMEVFVSKGDQVPNPLIGLREAAAAR